MIRLLSSFEKTWCFKVPFQPHHINKIQDYFCWFWNSILELFPSLYSVTIIVASSRVEQSARMNTWICEIMLELEFQDIKTCIYINYNYVSLYYPIYWIIYLVYSVISIWKYQNESFPYEKSLQLHYEVDNS